MFIARITMDVTWKDLLVLLQGKNNISATCDAILEVIESDLVSLPDIFHSLAFDLLLSNQSNTRANASLLLGKLSLHFANILQPLVCGSCSDGDLLQLEDIKISTILATPGSGLLSNAVDYTHNRESGDDVYTTEWLQKQRAELKARMGLEANIVAAIDEIMDTYLHTEDVVSEHAAHPGVHSSVIPYNLSSSSSTPTEESWLARIVRCMIIGLLSPRWETRHGYAQGLSQLLRGLLPSLVGEDLAHLNVQDGVGEATPLYLPEFLCNDILCCGICVLLLDRFVDFGCSSTLSGAGAVAPVKEVAGVLISCAMQCSSAAAEKAELLWRLVCEMAAGSSEHWTIALGGFIGIKSFASFQCGFIVTEKWDEFVGVLAQGIRSVHSSEAEIAVAACDALRAFSQAAALQHDHRLLTGIGERCVTGLTLLLQACEHALCHTVSAEEDPLSSAVWMAVSDAMHCSVGLYVQAAFTCTPNLTDSTCLVLCLRNYTQLLGKLFLYDAEARRHCLENLSSSFISLASIINHQFSLADHQIIQGELFSVFGALCGASCLSSQRPVVELQLEDPPSSSSSSGSRQPRRRSKKPSIRLAGLEQDAAVPVQDEDEDQQGVQAVPTRCEPLVAVRHYLAEREVWERLTGTWSALAFAHIGHCDVDQAVPSEQFVSLVGMSVQRILTVVGRSFEAETSFDGIEPNSDGSGAERTFRHALETFCRCEALRRPLENTSAGSANKLLYLANLAQFDFLSVVLRSVCSATACLVESLEAKLREVVSKFISVSLAPRRQTTECPIKAASTKIVAPPEQQQQDLAVAAPKKRVFRFVVVPDTAEQAKKKPSATSNHNHGIDGSEAVGVQVKNGSSSSSSSWRPGANGDDLAKLWLTRLLCLMHVEMTALTCHPPPSDRDATLPLLLHPLGDIAHRAECDSSSQQTVALLQQALAGNSLEAIHFFALSPVHELGTAEAQLQVLVALLTSRDMLSRGSAANDFFSLWQLFGRGDGAERFAREVTYILAKTQQSSFADLYTGLFCCNDATLSVAVEKVMGSALLACTAATRAALNARYDIVGLVLDAAGTVEQEQEPQAPGHGRITRLAEVLCLLFRTEDRDGEAIEESGPTPCSSASLLPTTAARLYLRLFGEKVASSAAVAARGQLAELLCSLTSALLGQVVGAYEILFATALRGLGDREAGVRRACVRVFRQLVPLAALAKQTSSRRASSSLPVQVENVSREVQVAVEKASELLQHIFTKQSPFRIQKSQQQRDLHVMRTLAQCTNLVTHQSAALAPAQLRDYQWDGVSWLTQLRRFGLNGILADEMGLGKSLQALTALAVLRIEKNMQSAPSLIVCPASVVMHWEDEIRKYFPPSLLCPVRFASNMPAAAVAAALKDGATVMVVSYELMRRDVMSGHRSVLKAMLWETVVLDEAHLIKNPAAGSTKTACSLQSLHRMALTGTPVQNQVEELWSLMNFLLPDYIGNYKQFRKDVVNPIQRSFAARRELRQGQQRVPQENETVASASKGKGNKKDDALAKFHQAIEISSAGLSLLRTLHKQVLPFILRRSKEMVARDLPSKTVIDLLCPLSKEQRQLYVAYQERLRTSDDALEKEFLEAKDGGADSLDAEDATQFELVCTELATKTAQRQTQTLCASSVDTEGWGGSGGATRGTGILVLPSFDDGEEEQEDVKPTTSRLHAFEALNYLKLLCLHPALVVDSSHSRFRARLLQSANSSGKLVRLAALLLESGVVAREEFNSTLSIDNLLQLDGELMEQHSAPLNSDEESESNAEEIGNRAEENTARDPEWTHRSSEKNESAGKRGTQRKAPKTKDSKPQPAAAEHLDASLSEQIAAPPLHRCLIFAQHRAALDLVEEQVLGRYFPSVHYERLDGSMEPLKRSTIARKFNSQQRHGDVANAMVYLPAASDQQDDAEAEAVRAQQVATLMTALPTAARHPDKETKNAADKSADEDDIDIRILLMTTRSCGLGLNLTAADTVIFLEHDWNPFADLQAMDRVHRLGQTQPVTVYRLLAESTVEARIMRLQHLKQGIASQIINEENAGSAGAIGDDDINGDNNKDNDEGDGVSKRAGPQFGTALLGSLLLRPDSTD